MKEYILLPLAEYSPTLPTSTSQLSDFMGSLKPKVRHGQKRTPEKFSGTSLNLRGRHLRAFYSYLADVRAIPTNIKWNRIIADPDSKLPRILTRQEVDKLLTRAANDNFQAFVMIRLMLESGPRAEEVALLLDTDLRETQIRVEGKTGVHGSPDRFVPLKPQTRAWLQQLVDEHGPGPIFRARVHNKPMTSDGVKARVQKTMQRAGIQGDKRGAHTLRHTFATSFFKATKNLVGLALILGHVSKNGRPNLQTTQIYVTLAGRDMDEAFDEFAWEGLPEPARQGELVLEGATA